MVLAATSAVPAFKRKLLLQRPKHADHCDRCNKEEERRLCHHSVIHIVFRFTGPNKTNTFHSQSHANRAPPPFGGTYYRQKNANG